MFIIITDCNQIQKIKTVSLGRLEISNILIEVCQDKELAYEKGGSSVVDRDVDVLSIMDVTMDSQNIML